MITALGLHPAQILTVFNIEYLLNYIAWIFQNPQNNIYVIQYLPGFEVPGQFNGPLDQLYQDYPKIYMEQTLLYWLSERK